MIRHLKNRFRAFVDTCIGEYMLHYRDELADMASRMVRPDLEPWIAQVVDRVKTGHTVEYDRLAECIDMEELAKQFDTAELAGDMDYSSLASEVDMSELAKEFDTSDIAGEIDLSEVASAFDEDSIADRVVESLDYKSLARAILAEIRAEPVTVRPSA
jgi:hypothetical protein